MSPEHSEELDAFFQSYGRDFASGNLAAIDAMCEYPLAVCEGQHRLQVANKDYYGSLMQQFRQTAFAQSRFLGMQKLAMGKDGAVLFVSYRRLNAAGDELEPGTLPFPNGCAYFLKRRADGWKIIGLADRLGIS